MQASEEEPKPVEKTQLSAGASRLALFVAAGALALALYNTALTHRGDDAGREAEVTTLRADISALSGQLAALKAEMAGARPARAPDKAPLPPMERLQAVETKIDGLDSVVSAMQGAVARTQLQDRRLTMTLALQAAVLEGRPFPAEIDWVRRLADDEQTRAAVDILIPYSRRGVASMQDLRDALDQSDFADSVARAGASDLPFVQRSRAAIAGALAGVGLSQAPEPNAIEAALETMRSAMARGHLAEALAAAQAMQGSAATVMAPWIARARARLLVEDIVGRLVRSTLKT